MKRIGLLLGFFAVVIFAVPSWTAQEVKKDADKTEKKDDEKKDEKKGEKKPAPEKLVFSVKFVTKVMSTGANSSRELTVEKYELDPKKQQDYQTWRFQRQQALAKQQFEAARQTDFKARANALANYNKALYDFEIENAKRSNNLMSVKPMELRAAETAKVRTLFPPVEFDDLGFQKKWTKKELEERRDNTGLPGFAVDFDAIKTGQYVEVYLAKVAPVAKAGKKKGPDDDDPPPMAKGQEFVLIVIRQEAAGK